MGGVDKADQLVTYYAFSHCSKKWWKRVFFHLLEVSIVNSYIIYISSTKRLTHLDFHITLAKQLTEVVHTFTQATTPSPAKGMPLRLIGRNHYPEPARGKLDCRVCSNRQAGKRKQTSFQCTTCKVPLCIYPCFKRYHTLQHFK